MEDENKITEAERKQAQELSKSFAGESRKVGPDQLRKITQAGMTILSMAGNRFVKGFDKSGVKDLQDGNVMPYTPDVIQWREVCAAGREQLREWMSSPDSFKQHWQDVMLDSQIDLNKTSEMFFDVFDAYQEIMQAQVQVKPDKSSGKGSRSTPKKKARSRAKKRNTSSP